FGFTNRLLSAPATATAAGCERGLHPGRKLRREFRLERGPVQTRKTVRWYRACRIVWCLFRVRARVRGSLRRSPGPSLVIRSPPGSVPFRIPRNREPSPTFPLLRCVCRLLESQRICVRELRAGYKWKRASETPSCGERSWKLELTRPRVPGVRS
uniref:Uncharacterized protein n=1 Tax=Anopheles albimanus TaxID=7167 RepID=A0A182F7C3_ANOAL